MVQVADRPRAVTSEPAPAPPCVWGLDAAALHDAYWHARGVQVVRRGRRAPLQRAAELYLLLEADELACFDIARWSERLAWHDALVTRIRIDRDVRRRYSEHVVRDDRDLVVRIERRYGPPPRGADRVVLTSRRRVAALWMAAPNRREGWRRVRRAVPWSRVDHGRLPGEVFRLGSAASERRFVDRLVAGWTTPSQSIDGIEAVDDGVWRLRGDDAPRPDVLIGPLWLGAGADDSEAGCRVGPEWTNDRDGAAAEHGAARVRPIVEVSLGERRRGDHGVAARPGYAALKRGLDVAVSLVGLALCLPAMALIAVLIRLEDGGPIFFGHRRQGRGGRPFRCWKFRTMHPNAEQLARDLEAYNVCDGPQVFIVDDPRVTRIGRRLRQTHLDELPQLWNVLRGQMSLVGPRPSPDDENQFCPAWRDIRLSVRPGITGLWQLHRRRDPGEDFQEWIKYDIEYVRRAGLWLDLVVLAQTAVIIVMGRPDRAPD